MPFSSKHCSVSSLLFVQDYHVVLFPFPETSKVAHRNITTYDDAKVMKETEASTGKEKHSTYCKKDLIHLLFHVEC